MHYERMQESLTDLRSAFETHMPLIHPGLEQTLSFSCIWITLPVASPAHSLPLRPMC